MTRIPGYWMDETSGVLRPAVETYLAGQPMTEAQIVAMRAYLCQWIVAPGFAGPEIEQLRLTVDSLATEEAISFWIDCATDAGADPL